MSTVFASHMGIAVEIARKLPGWIGLRPLSGVLVAAYGCAGLVGLGVAVAALHALWFCLLLTRKGRVVLTLASIIVGLGWLMACATLPRSGTCLAGAALLVVAAVVWLAAKGMDELEAFWHGRSTEGSVRRHLERLVKRLQPRGQVRHEVLLRSGDHFTEIDHVVVTASGVLVVETKGYTGTIDYDPDTATWWRTTKGGRVETIDDPIAQNEGHLRAVSKILPSVPATSLVVMPRAMLGLEVPRGVVGMEGLSQLATWEGITGGSYDVDQLSRAVDKANQSNDANRQAHLAWVQGVRGNGRVNPIWQMRRVQVAASLYFGVPILLSVASLVAAIRSALFQ